VFEDNDVQWQCLSVVIGDEQTGRGTRSNVIAVASGVEASSGPRVGLARWGEASLDSRCHLIQWCVAVSSE